MPIVASVQAGNAPPRIQITLTSPNGTAITAATLYRATPAGNVLVRVQPPVPAASGSVFYDYEAPWDTALVYLVLYTYGSGTSTSETSNTVTLSPLYPWLIHPTAPSLSVCLDQARFDRMGVVSLGTETRPALKTKHRIQGSEFQIVTKSGPRGAQSFPMQVALTSAAERAALVSVTRDQTPLLVQVPASWGWDFDNGYYDIDDVGTERALQYGPELRRTVTLPLERVEEPIGTQAATWTWAGFLSGSSTWDAAKAAYATWADVATNTRR